MTSEMPSISLSPRPADVIAAAAENRTRQLPHQPSALQMAAEHEKRQKFRRLIDPGIVRPNSKEQALTSLKTLLRIAENIIREPEEPKYQRFKPTNTLIKRDLIDPKGALEYAIELGFHPEVVNFQPFYVFNPRRMGDLSMGAGILKDYIDLEVEKATRAALAKKEEKAVAAAAAEKVKLAFMDDRKSKSLIDEREKERRAAKSAIVAQQSVSPDDDDAPTPGPMPGAGYTLNSRVDVPPPYAPEIEESELHNEPPAASPTS